MDPIALDDPYRWPGQPDKAQAQANVVRAIQRLNAAAGMNVDMELALFEAEHGDAAQAVTLARAAYAQRPSIYAADALAWALYQHGEPAEAARFSRLALRLGTRDALLHFHAGRIALALGDQAAARAHLETALAINRAFSVRYAPVARALLVTLSATAEKGM